MRRITLKALVTAVLVFFCVFAVQYKVQADVFIPVNMNGNIYCINSSGALVINGWANIGNDFFYFGPDGVLVTNMIVDGFTVGPDGRAVLDMPAEEVYVMPPEDVFVMPEVPAPAINTDSLIAQTCLNIINSVTNPAMTQDQKLAAVYSYVVKNHKYNRTYETPSGNWTGQYALELFTNGYGNCYRFACGFAYLAKALGYETKVITGSVHAARGGVTPHSWVEIFYNGGWYICDPELQMAKGRDMYMRTYNNYPIKPLIKQAEWGVIF
ncbi:MAG: hypothetical protein K5770_13315 [Lachnospiraceae bacterium]|nr:hypothetical protein [Lachnospiraceae bacterium]